MSCHSRKPRLHAVIAGTLLILVGLASYADADECKWVETSGESVVENVTPEEARQAALTRARVRAVESAGGIEVKGLSVVKDFALIADFVTAMSAGSVAEETVLGWETRSVHDKTEEIPLVLMRVNLRSCVKTGAAGDPYFKVKGELNRPVFLAGEEATITAACTKDCFLTILNMTADNKVLVLYPNLFDAAKRVESGKSLVFPSRNGIVLEMNTLPGHAKDSEAFFLIATKEKFDLSGVVKKNGELTTKDLYRTLFALPADARAEEILVYEVRSRD